MEMDLVRFKDEVVSKGAESCLPSNLPDEWLYSLNQAYEDVYAGVESVTLAGPMMAIIEIMTFKLKKTNFSIEGNEMKRLIEDYRLELAFEVVSRNTELQANPADLQTIFTNRNVQFKNK